MENRWFPLPYMGKHISDSLTKGLQTTLPTQLEH